MVNQVKIAHTSLLLRFYQLEKFFKGFSLRGQKGLRGELGFPGFDGIDGLTGAVGDEGEAGKLKIFLKK